jgi:hypothetical protein
MELHNTKYLRARLFALAIVISLAFILEWIAYSLFQDRPVLQVKAMGMISLGLIAYLVHTSYHIWNWYNSPFQQEDLD